ncbi:hypothetical protein L3Q82_022516 [Scortum barcoo]|uniref:Uncharacterized protein n=1 Tax=Scortum barcoo TaxID=214431 RepID=A0ACB8X1H0_9TELE|nr:hypothetical protein L3Q82_022516 [Scortum barcoo]
MAIIIGTRLHAATNPFLLGALFYSINMQDVLQTRAASPESLGALRGAEPERAGGRGSSPRGTPPGPSAATGELSKTRSRYKDHSPTLGRKSRAATSSPANCSSLFSFRLISPEEASEAAVKKKEEEEESSKSRTALLLYAETTFSLTVGVEVGESLEVQFLAHTLKNLWNECLRICHAVVKARGGYFEESKV